MFDRMTDAIAYALRGVDASIPFEIVPSSMALEESREQAGIYAEDAETPRVAWFFREFAAGTTNAAVRQIVRIHQDGAREWAGDIFTTEENGEFQHYVGYAA